MKIFNYHWTVSSSSGRSALATQLVIRCLGAHSGESIKSEEADPYQFQGPWEIRLISPGALLMSIMPRISRHSTVKCLGPGSQIRQDPAYFNHWVLVTGFPTSFLNWFVYKYCARGPPGSLPARGHPTAHWNVPAMPEAAGPMSMY